MPDLIDYRIVLCSGRRLIVGPVRWWWRIESVANSQVLATSETYSTRQKQEQTARRLSDATGVRIVTE